MKIIAFYLPQFHNTKQNDEWWGTGFTEWSNMKKSHSLFEGHYQPRIPLNENYYNLLDINVMKWQTDLAKKYGIYGFCVYHYWSEQGMLLEKPMEQYLNHKEIDFPFCFCWANESWTNSWASDSRHPQVLWKQTYGDHSEWKRHFNYLLPFFRDDRYIQINGKPLLVIYRPEQIPHLNKMLDYFNELAIMSGLKGLTYAAQQKDFYYKHCDSSRFTFIIEYQPSYAEQDLLSPLDCKINRMKENVIYYTQKFTGKSIPKMQKLAVFDYENIWHTVLNREPDNSKMVPGAFVDWDNSPRYGKRSIVFKGATPDKFSEYMEAQIIHAKKDYQKDIIFLFAWNEWSEGGYLEPDQKWGYGYLEGLKRALLKTKEI